MAGEIVLALDERGDHAPPDVSALIVPRLGQMARQGEDERHAVLGDGIPVDAARIRERDAPRAEVVERELVVARADGLDVGQPLRPRQDLVAPEARDDQDIRRPTRASVSSRVEVWKWATPVPRASNRSARR